MYFTYILKSTIVDKFYIGSTRDLEGRVLRHNQGRERYTKKYKPWILEYWREFESRSGAYLHERYLKSLKSKSALIKLISDEQQNKKQ